MQRNLQMSNVLAISQPSLPYLPFLFPVLVYLALHHLLQNSEKKKLVCAKCWAHQRYNLWQMFSKEFALLVIISCFIAIPLAWYYLNNWLQQYDYRTSISVWIFIASGFGALVITLLTVSFQAIKAAIANPVKSLRTD